MENISIKAVTIQDFYKVANLRLAENQKNVVASNVYSIAESKVNPCYTPFAIYLGEEVIGFTMTDYDPTLDDKNKYWIPRLMLDEQHQGKGYGKKAMKILLEQLFSNEDCSCVRLSTKPTNSSAIRFYETIGFVQTGELLQETEVILELNKGN